MLHSFCNIGTIIVLNFDRKRTSGTRKGGVLPIMNPTRKSIRHVAFVLLKLIVQSTSPCFVVALGGDADVGGTLVVGSLVSDKNKDTKSERR